MGAESDIGQYQAVEPESLRDGYRKTVIEFAGTPYPYKDENFLDGGFKTDLEMIFGRPPYIHKGFDLGYGSGFEDFRDKIPEMLAHYYKEQESDRICLESGGPFQAIVFVEYYSRIGQITPDEAHTWQEFLLIHARKIDRIIATEVRPRAALASFDFRPDIFGGEDDHERGYIHYQVFNECLHAVVERYNPQLPNLRLIRIQGDEFDYGLLKAENAAAMYETLSMSLTDEEYGSLQRQYSRNAEKRLRPLPLFSWQQDRDSVSI